MFRPCANEVRASCGDSATLCGTAHDAAGRTRASVLAVAVKTQHVPLSAETSLPILTDMKTWFQNRRLLRVEGVGRLAQLSDLSLLIKPHLVTLHSMKGYTSAEDPNLRTNVSASFLLSRPFHKGSRAPIFAILQ
jgi:hypothetical protein